MRETVWVGDGATDSERERVERDGVGGGGSWHLLVEQRACSGALLEARRGERRVGFGRLRGCAEAELALVRLVVGDHGERQPHLHHGVSKQGRG